MRKILQYIKVCIILHNILVEVDGNLPADWFDWEDFSDIDDDQRAPSEDEFGLFPAVPNKNIHTSERRRQLTVFMNEVHVM